MARTAADILIETIHAWGIDTIFGIPGDGINGIMESLRKRQDKIRFIQTRHEEAAAFMACAYAKFTGRIGCCLSTSGPGGIHLLNGLYDAKLDGVPVLAITGLQYHDLIGTFTQQDVALDKLFMDVAVFNERVMGPTHMENMAALACRMALSRRGVAHLTIPVDFQEETVKDDTRSMRNEADHNSHVYAKGARLPDEKDIQRAAAVLNAGKKIGILAGRGALNAGDELEMIAERLGAPVIKALLGKACLSDDNPYTTGGIGLLGTRPSVDVMENCDTLLIAGASFPYIEFYPKPGQAKIVQIDLDPMRIGLRCPVEVGLVGDTQKTLAALLPLLERNKHRKFLETTQKDMKTWMGAMHKMETATVMPMKPQAFAYEIGRRLSPNAIVCGDSGTNTSWWARHIHAQRGQMHSCSGTLATMANGLPYAIAAQLAYPDRQVIAFVGDGGYSMLMAEMATAVKYKLPIKVFIVKNGSLGQIKWEQMVFLGNPEFECDLQPIDFAMQARSCGALGVSVDNPKYCGGVVEQVLRHPGPAVVEGIVDGNEPPMPGKITVSQAMHFAEAMLRGTKDRGKIIGNVVEDQVRELI